MGATFRKLVAGAGLRRTLLVSTALVGGALPGALRAELPSGLALGGATATPTITRDANAGLTPGDLDGSGDHLTIGVGGNASIFNWQTFNVTGTDAGGAARSVTFDRGALTGTVSVLNRVNEANGLSTIAGPVTATGIDLWLVNGAGITFGAGGAYSGGSLVLSTAAITDDEFLTGGTDGRHDFTGGAGGVSLSGAGAIDSTGAIVVVAPRIDVAKALTATRDVALIAAGDVSLPLQFGSPLSIVVGKGTPLGTARINVDGSVQGANVVMAGFTGSVVDALLQVGAAGALTATAADGRIVIAAGRETPAAAAGPSVALVRDTDGNVAATDIDGAVNVTVAGALANGGNDGAGNLQLAAGDYTRTGAAVTLAGTIAAAGRVTIRATDAAGTGITGAALQSVTANSDGSGAETLTLDSASAIDLAATSALFGGSFAERSNVDVAVGAGKGLALGTVTAARLANGALVAADQGRLQTSGDVALRGPVTLTDTLDIETVGTAAPPTGAIRTGAVSVAAGDLRLTTSGSGLDIRADALSASGTVAVRARQAAAVGNASAGSDLTVRGASVELSGTETAQGAVTITADNGSIAGAAGLVLQANSDGGIDGPAEYLTLAQAGTGGIALGGSTLIGGSATGSPPVYGRQSSVVVAQLGSGQPLTLGDVFAGSLALPAGGTAGPITARDISVAGDLTLSGGSIRLRSAESLSGSVALTATTGDVTGLAADPDPAALLPGFGRASLRATGNSAARVSVTAAAGTVQLGVVRAGSGPTRTAVRQVGIDARAVDVSDAAAANGDLGLAATAGDVRLAVGAAANGAKVATTAGNVRVGSLTAGSGGIIASSGAGTVDVTRAVSGGTLALTATGGAVRLGVLPDGSSNPDGYVDGVGSTAAGAATLRSQGAAGGDVLVGTALTAAAITVDSAANARLAGGDATPFTEHFLRATGGDLTVIAAGDVTGLAAPASPAGAGVRIGTLGGAGGATLSLSGESVIDSIDVGGSILLTSNGDVRLGSARSASGNIGIGTADLATGALGGSLTGLADNPAAITAIAGADLKASGAVRVTAQAAGARARLGQVEAGTDIAVTASYAEIDRAAAGGALTLTAPLGLHLRSGSSGTGMTIGGGGGAGVAVAADTVDDDRLAEGYGATQLTAGADNARVVVRASRVAQLGQVSAGASDAASVAGPAQVAVQAAAVTADGLAARNGALDATATAGPLYVRDARSAAAATLSKAGEAGAAGRDELRLGTLAAGGAAAIASATEARIGTVAGQGAVTVNAGLPTNSRGAVTGLRLAAGSADVGIAAGYGRAQLSSAAAGVTVGAGGVAQLGLVQAAGAIAVTSGRAAGAGIVAVNGAIDLTRAAAGGDLRLAAYDATAAGTGIRLGLRADGSADPAGSDGAAGSTAAGSAALTTAGGSGDVVVGSALAANAGIGIDSVASIRIAQRAAATDPGRIASRDGSVSVNARGGDVTGLLLPVAAGDDRPEPGYGLFDIAAGAAVTITASDDVQAGDLTAGSDIDVAAGLAAGNIAWVGGNAAAAAGHYRVAGGGVLLGGLGGRSQSAGADVLVRSTAGDIVGEPGLTLTASIAGGTAPLILDSAAAIRFADERSGAVSTLNGGAANSADVGVRLAAGATLQLGDVNALTLGTAVSGAAPAYTVQPTLATTGRIVALNLVTRNDLVIDNYAGGAGAGVEFLAVRSLEGGIAVDTRGILSGRPTVIPDRYIVPRLDAARGIVVTASRAILGDVTAGTGIDLYTIDGVLEVANARALGGDIRLTAASFGVRVDTAEASAGSGVLLGAMPPLAGRAAPLVPLAGGAGNIAITAAGDINGTIINNNLGRDVALVRSNSGSVNIASNANDAIVGRIALALVEARGGDATVTGRQVAISDRVQSFAGNVAVTANQTGAPRAEVSATIADARASGNVTATVGYGTLAGGAAAENGNLRLGSATAGGAIALTARDGGIGRRAGAATRTALDAGGAIDTASGRSTELGQVRAGGNVTVAAGDAAIPGASAGSVSGQAGTVDVTRVTSGGSLLLAARDGAVRLGAAADGSSDPAGYVAGVASTAAGLARLQTLAAGGDVVVGSALTAASIAIGSAANARLPGGDATPFTQHFLRATAGDVAVNVDGDVTGLVARADGPSRTTIGRLSGPGGTTLLLGGESVLGAIDVSGAIDINASGDVRLGPARSANGSINIGAGFAPVQGPLGGSLTGLADGGSTFAAVTGADIKASGGIQIRSTGIASRGQLGQLEAGGDINIDLKRVEIDRAAAGAMLAISAAGGLYLRDGSSGTGASIISGGGLGPAAPLDLIDDDRLAEGYGVAHLTAGANNARIVVRANRVAQLGTVVAGASDAAGAASPAQVSVQAGAVTADALAARNGALEVAATAGPLYVRDARATGAATLTKAGTAGAEGRDELRLGTLAAASASIASSTDARIGSVTGTGAVTVTGGTPTVAARGAVTGLRLAQTAAATGIVPGYGRAQLTSSSGAVTVTAATTAQLGLVRADAGIGVTAGRAAATGVVAAGGAIDLTRAVAGGDLRLAAYNAAANGAGIRIGLRPDGSGDPAGLDGTAGTTAGGIAMLITTGASGDILVGSGLTAGSAPLDSVANVRLSGGTGRGVVATVGDVTVNAAGDVTGLALTTPSTDGRLVPGFGRGDIAASSAGRTVRIAARDNVQLGTVRAGTGVGTTAGDQLGIDAGAIDLVEATAANGTLRLGSTAGEIRVASASGGTDASVTAAAGARLGTLAARTGDVAVTATTGDVTGLRLADASGYARAAISAPGAARTVTVTAANGTALLGTVTAGAGAGRAAADQIGVTAREIDATRVAAGNGNLRLTATAGEVRLVTGSAGADAAVQAAASARVGTLASDTGNIAVTATAGDVTGLRLTDAGGYGRADLNAAAAARTVRVTAAGGTAQLGSVSAGTGNSAASGDQVAVDARAIDVATAVAANGNLRLTSTEGTVRLGDASANLNATVDAANGAAIGTLASATGNVAVTARAGDAVAAALTAAAADRTVKVAAANGTATLTRVAAGAGTGTSAGEQIAVDARGIDVGTAAAANGALRLTSTVGEVRLGNGSAGGDGTVRAATPARIDSLASRTGNVAVTAAAGDVAGRAAGTRTNLAAMGAGRGIAVRADNGAATLGTVEAGAGSVTSTGDQIAVDARSIDVDRATVANGSLRLTSGTGAVRLGTGTANLNGTLDAGNGATVTALTAASGNVAVTARSGNVDAGTLAATAGNVAVTARSGNVVAASLAAAAGGRTVTVAAETGRAQLGTVRAGDQVAITAADVALGGAVNAGTKLAVMLGQGGSSVALGGAAGDNVAGQLGLNQAELALVTAPAVEIRAGAKPIAIGALALADAAGSTSFKALSTGTVTLTGALTGAGATTRTLQLGGTGDASALGSTQAVDPARLATRLAAQTEGGAAIRWSGAVDLRAGEIVFGDATLRAQAQGDPAAVAEALVARPNSILYGALDPDARLGGGATPATFLRADTLNVSYSRFALFQNSGTSLLPGGVELGPTPPATTTGVSRLRLFSNGEAPANGFALFGTINGFQRETAVLQVGIADFTGAGGPRITLNNSRVNGCVIGSPDKGCLVTDVPPPTFRLFDERQLQLLGAADDLTLPFSARIGTSNEGLIGDILLSVSAAQDAACDAPDRSDCPREGKSQ